MFTFWKRCRHVLYFSGQVLFSSFVVVVPVAVGQASLLVLRSVFFKKLFFAVRRWLEAMLPRLRSGSNVGMFSQVSRWPNVGKGFVHV